MIQQQHGPQGPPPAAGLPLSGKGPEWRCGKFGSRFDHLPERRACRRRPARAAEGRPGRLVAFRISLRPHACAGAQAPASGPPGRRAAASTEQEAPRPSARAWRAFAEGLPGLAGSTGKGRPVAGPRAGPFSAEDSAAHRPRASYSTGQVRVSGAPMRWPGTKECGHYITYLWILLLGPVREGPYDSSPLPAPYGLEKKEEASLRREPTTNWWSAQPTWRICNTQRGSMEPALSCGVPSQT
jgi:hypothetical protein